MFEPGSMGDPFPLGSPGVATSGLQPGGPSWMGVRGPVGATPVPDVGRITPGDSVLAQVYPGMAGIASPVPAAGGLGQAPHANSSARLGPSSGTYPS
jgi:hypothetical protein